MAATECELVPCHGRRQFGYHVVKSSHMTISEDGFIARKSDPECTYAYGVCFGGRKLRGDAFFEVMLTDLGTTWSGTFKLGVMRISRGSKLKDIKIPRYSPDAPSFCVWCNQKLHNRLPSGTDCEFEVPYGSVCLDNLKCGDRLGLQISRDGDLSFFVNDCFQGVATSNVYLRGYDVYAVVDHYGRCKATTVTRSGVECEELKEKCMEKILSCLKDKMSICQLPLPPSVKLQLHSYMQDM